MTQQFIYDCLVMYFFLPLSAFAFIFLFFVIGLVFFDWWENK